MAWSNPKPNYYDMTEKEKTFRHAAGKLYLQLCSESGSTRESDGNHLLEYQLNCTPTVSQTDLKYVWHNTSAGVWSWMDLRLPKARRVVSEAFRNLMLKIVVVKMPPDISTPQDAAPAIDQNPTCFTHTPTT